MTEQQNHSISERAQQKTSRSVNYLIKKCDGQEDATMFCINQACPEKNPFICNQEEKCVCSQAHHLCKKADIDAAQKEIQKKVNKKMHNEIYILNQTIYYLSSFQQKIKDQIKQFSLSQNEKKFKYLFTTPKFKYDMNSKQLSQMWASILIKPQIQQQVDQIIKKQITKLHQTILKGCQKIQALIKQASIQRKIQKKQNILNKVQKTEQTAPLIILDQNNVKQRLINFLSKRKVNKFELVFKASQHQFSIKKYFKKCGSLQNTVIICKSDKNKVFGGFTPLSFNPEKNQKSDYQYVNDPSGQSFLFSINQNSNFQNSTINKQAIVRYRKKSRIVFSGTLYILNERGCQFYLDDNYYSTKSYPKVKQSYLKLTGSQSSICKLAEWEVYQVHFQ